MSDSRAGHTRTNLAHGPICSIDVCSCGSLHLTLGALTLRFEPSAGESLWATLGEALAELHSRREREEARLLWGASHPGAGRVS